MFLIYMLKIGSFKCYALATPSSLYIFQLCEPYQDQRQRQRRESQTNRANNFQASIFDNPLSLLLFLSLCSVLFFPTPSTTLIVHSICSIISYLIRKGWPSFLEMFRRSESRGHPQLSRNAPPPLNAQLRKEGKRRSEVLPLKRQNEVYFLAM